MDINIYVISLIIATGFILLLISVNIANSEDILDEEHNEDLADLLDKIKNKDSL